MPRVAVVGSVNLDLVATCSRLPKPGETVLATGFARYPGGKGANQALAAQRAGSEVTLFAAVGADPEAAEATSLLDDEGVDLTRLHRSSEPTGLAFIAVDGTAENQIVVISGANSRLAPIDASGFDVVLCQREVPDATIEAAFRSATGLTILNAAPAEGTPDQLLELADVVVVNETERDLLGSVLTATDALVVVTLGERGVQAFSGRREIAASSAPHVEVVDTVAAGDAFCGALVTELGSGTELSVALRVACAAGALATTRPGAQPSLPTRAEIDEATAI